MNDCIFCKILNKEIPSEFVYEDDLVVAFFDIAKLAPVHILIIPKKHIPSINDLPDDESGVNIAGHMIITAKKLAKTEGLFVGMSSGANIFAAKQISQNLKQGNIVVIIPDRGEKYLSTKLFK